MHAAADDDEDQILEAGAKVRTGGEIKTEKSGQHFNSEQAISKFVLIFADYVTHF